jgi:hypothetical protein
LAYELDLKDEMSFRKEQSGNECIVYKVLGYYGVIIITRDDEEEEVVELLSHYIVRILAVILW